MPSPQTDKQSYTIRAPKAVEQRNWLARIVEKMQQDKFFGTVTVHFKEGEMVLVDKNETFKPPT